jgi:hypothetical protein
VQASESLFIANKTSGVSLDSQTAFNFEPFVDADRVAEFLSMPRREVLKLTREGTITAYPISGRIRKTFKYRLSEVGRDVALLRKPSRIMASSPSGSSAKHRSLHGEEI